MLVGVAVRQLAVVTVGVMLWSRAEAGSSVFRICGRQLSDYMSRVCHVFNSPAWDMPRVVEQPTAAVRRKRQVGIVDECCLHGCTWKQLTEYCAVSAPETEFLKSLHLISDRSAEKEDPSVVRAPVLERRERKGGKVKKSWERLREVGKRNEGKAVGGGLRRGAEPAGRRRRRRRCGCARGRSGRRRAVVTGNTNLIGARNVIRAAPVVGTVSPLLTWGRTLNTDLPPGNRERYSYLAVYST